MSLRSAEEIHIDSALASLRAFLPALCSEYAIPAPAEGSYYFGGEPAISEYPAVEVASASADLSRFGIGQLAGDLASRMVVVGWTREPVWQTLARTSYRFAEAIMRVLMRPEAFGSRVLLDNERSIQAVYGMSDPDNPDNRSRQEFTAHCILFFPLADQVAR